jgi:hypothetical protein
VAKKKKPLRLLKHLLLLRLLRPRHLLLHPLQQKHPLLLRLRHLLLRLLLNQQNSNALRQGRYTCGDQQKTALGRFFFVCASQFLGMGNAVL